MSRLPDFLVIGEAKCGTQSLCNYLAQHRDVFLSDPSETNFFNNDEYYRRGTEAYAQAYFRDADGAERAGESAPKLLSVGHKVIPRVKESLPLDKLRFFVLLRDPVERAWSHYLHWRRLAWEQNSFEDAIAAERACDDYDTAGLAGYFNRGLYATHLAEWRSHFPEEAFLILFSEDLRRDTEAIVRRCFRFLEVDDQVPLDTAARHNVASTPRHAALMRFTNRPNVGHAIARRLLPMHLRRRLLVRLRRSNLRPMAKDEKPQMNSETEAWLRRAYADDLRRLQSMVGRDLSAWLP